MLLCLEERAEMCAALLVYRPCTAELLQSYCEAAFCPALAPAAAAAWPSPNIVFGHAAHPAAHQLPHDLVSSAVHEISTLR